MYDTYRSKTLKLNSVGKARKPIPADKTEDGVAVEVGKPYWWVQDYRRPRRVWGGSEPTVADRTVMKPLSRLQQIEAIRGWLSYVDTPTTPQEARDLADACSEAQSTLQGFGGEYAESRDNMPAEGSPMWDALDEMANGLEDFDLDEHIEALREAADAMEADESGEDSDDDDAEEAESLEDICDEIRQRDGDIPEWGG